MSKKFNSDCARDGYNWALFLAGDKASLFADRKVTFGQATQSLYFALKQAGYDGDLYTRMEREPRFRSIARDLYAWSATHGWDVARGKEWEEGELQHAPADRENFRARAWEKLSEMREAGEALLDSMTKRSGAHLTHSQVDHAARKRGLSPADLSRFVASRWGIGTAPRGKSDPHSEPAEG